MAFADFADDSKLIAVIADEDTVTGFLLAGVGCTTATTKNFFVVDEKTSIPDIEKAFTEFASRDDVGLIFISQDVAGEIRHIVNRQDPSAAVVLEIPSKSNPYDPSQDPVMQRVSQLLGE